MQEQDGGVNFVGIEEGGVSAHQFLVVPRIAVCGTDGIIAVSPISESPITGWVGDACMAHCRSKDVGTRALEPTYSFVVRI